LAKKRRLEYERQIKEQKKQVMNDIKNSQLNMSLGRESIKINDVEMNIKDVDMQKLTRE